MSERPEEIPDASDEAPRNGVSPESGGQGEGVSESGSGNQDPAKRSTKILPRRKNGAGPELFVENDAGESAPEKPAGSLEPAPGNGDSATLAATRVNGGASNGQRTWRLRAIISDIHGNLEAFRAVLADIEKQHVDEIVCLGDVVGYGPNPVQCLRTVRKIAGWSLCGNHDAAMFMSHAVGFNEMAAKAAAWQRSFMRPGFFSLPGKVARWRWLENLPAQRQEGPVMYVHASPRDPLMEYVLEEDFQDMGFGPSQKAVEMFERFDWVCFVGHSHRPGIATHAYEWIKPAELDEMSYVLPPGKKTIVNIGAVGQPRDQNPDACYVLFDGQKVVYRRVKYDLEKTMKKIRVIPELSDRLAERLARGA